MNDVQNETRRETGKLRKIFSGSRRFRPLGPGVLSELCQELGVMLRAGVPLDRALFLAATGEEVRPEAARALQQVRGLVCQGMLMWQAMAETRKAFPEVMIQTVRAAEQSGTLSRSFLLLARDYQQEHRTAAEIKRASAYPQLLLVMLVLLTWLFMAVILPEFEPLFAYMEEVPLPTKILFSLVSLVKTGWPILLAAGLILAAGIKAGLGWKKAALAADRIKLSLPGIGKVFRMVYTARFARTLGTLYQAGLLLPEAIRASGRASGSIYLESRAMESARLVEEGEDLAAALGRQKGFVKKLPVMIKIGEEAGDLGGMLLSAAESMDYEGRQAAGRLLSLLEPAMIMVMAVFVGLMMAAVLMPLYASYDGLGQNLY